jgi:hypothetical protein
MNVPSTLSGHHYETVKSNPTNDEMANFWPAFRLAVLRGNNYRTKLVNHMKSLLRRRKMEHQLIAPSITIVISHRANPNIGTNESSLLLMISNDTIVNIIVDYWLRPIAVVPFQSNDTNHTNMTHSITPIKKVEAIMSLNDTNCLLYWANGTRVSCSVANIIA